MANEPAAQWLRALQPSRLQRYLLSDLNPAMWTVKTLAQLVRAQRQPVSPDNPFVTAERQVAEQIERSLDAYRDTRDAWQERLFKAIYESPFVAALAGQSDLRRAPQAVAALGEEFKRLKLHEIESHMEEGSALDGGIRILRYQGREERVFDERPFRLVQQMIHELLPDQRPTLSELKGALRRQAFTLLLDEERALQALPKLLPNRDERQRALAIARKVATAKAGTLSPAQQKRFQRLEEILDLTGSRE